MPWITAITAIRVVVERIIPSSVRKLRSLLLRSESSATAAASKKEAREDFTIFRIRGRDRFCSGRVRPGRGDDCAAGSGHRRFWRDPLISEGARRLLENAADDGEQR